MDNLVNNKITDLQKYILKVMWEMELFPDTKPIKSSKIIGKVVDNCINYFTDSISVIVASFYSMSQPWLINEPLIMCRGYIGTNEMIADEWSGAASPLYTEATLTPAGMEYIRNNNILSIHLHC